MVIFTLLAAMVVTLILVSKKVNIGSSLIVGAVILALLNNKGIVYVFALLYKSAIERDTVSLGITVALISILGHLMEKYFILDRMITALEKMLRSTKTTILMAPAIIGTLLVTGGALMSCPVVNSLGKRLDIPEDKRAAINMIFRHALYFVFPLSPTILLAAKLGDYKIWDFIKLQAPVAITMYITGYLIYVKKYRDIAPQAASIKEYTKSVLQFLLYSSPILVSMLGAAIFSIDFNYSLLGGIAVSIAINIFDKRKDAKYDVKEPLYRTLYKGIKPSMVTAIVGIMVFKNSVNDISEILEQLRAFLDMGMPLELMIIVACALIAFPLASTQSGVAILYPMILPLAPSYDVKLLYAIFIYTNSFLFYFISPLHLCQVLTLEHFRVSIKRLLKNYVVILPVSYGVMVLVYVVNMWVR